MAKKKLAIEVGSKHTQSEDFELSVTGLEPGIYSFVFVTPDNRKVWGDVDCPEGTWEARYPCMYRGDYRLDVYGQPPLLGSGDGRGV